MRISDWSSDVCSSDLKKQDYFSSALTNDWNAHKRFLKVAIDDDGDLSEYFDVSAVGGMTQKHFGDLVDWFAVMDADLAKFLDEHGGKPSPKTAAISTNAEGDRSEEHTSELQSLMRISYDVFCLKKK